MKSILITFFLLLAGLAKAQRPALFKIIEDDKAGYIDTSGTIVIKPVFQNGTNFSEGLAAVRLNGHYGFIDQTGAFVIQPQYDIARPFSGGIAQVFKDGVPFFISKQNVILPFSFYALDFISNMKAIVTSKSGKQGLLDIPSGKLLIDTLYGSIEPSGSGLVIATEAAGPGEIKWRPRSTVIDTTGRIIVPFGKYPAIHSFSEGYATVVMYAQGTRYTSGVIDSTGQVIAVWPDEMHIAYGEDYHEGFISVDINRPAMSRKRSGDADPIYQVFADLKGRKVFDDPQYKYAFGFSAGRAFLMDTNKLVTLIDKQFKPVVETKFSKVQREKFVNGYAVVGLNNNANWGIVDTTGQFVVPPKYMGIHNAGVIDGYFFFKNVTRDGGYQFVDLYGIASLKGDTVLPPLMKRFDEEGFKNGLLEALVEDKPCYINRKGQIVWQQTAANTPIIKRLNTEYISEGYFLATATPKPGHNIESEMWYQTDNNPRKIADEKFPLNTLAVTIDTTKMAMYDDKYRGYQIFVSNTTGRDVIFSAKNSCINMILQALNSKGEWKDILLPPTASCDKCSHKIVLDPYSYWRFVMPDYEGEITTKIRAKLVLTDKKDPKNKHVVYSNEIAGSVNPAQFWYQKEELPEI
ncbi:WG repeat-containing protein [Chitinophaga agri]|uniref:WG repeat-containing protein n=1 Tax=Chitinophaga agri TaxID=2703787 RepID=A0A6B9ZCW8_9BACT|nr:WG repeat-containing protein [Chitinophaga agri]QHS60188.1 WG repeat-containing protein [Chitinophaga agri]